MSFDLARFKQFCAQLRIESKEHGLIKLGKLLGTQTHFMDEVAKGLEEGVHFFVCLKGRQLGISTISLALDLYWIFVHGGLQGSLTTHDEPSRDMFKSTLTMYMDGLPRKWKIKYVQHNRNQLVLDNRSRLYYQIAGTRNNGTLGRSKGMAFLHATEVSSWGDEEGLRSLISSLAENNPARLYIFESTARGFNMFHDMYKTAKRARTQREIFEGWWRNELYSAAPDSNIYKVYWDGKLKPEEREWVREIKKLYDVEINSRQIAWWRWKLAEEVHDESIMYQEFPPTEDYAFIMTGTSFFSHARCTDAAKDSKRNLPDCYRYVMGAYFQDTEVVKSTERLATLKVWEEPVDNGYYVIGADPSYGSSDHSDRFCVQVFRAYADGLDQVAEFCTPELNTYQFAWVISHLAGAYRNSTLNLEVNGPGQAVINELRNLKRQAVTITGQQGKELMNALGHMSHYIWRKNDSLGGASNSIGYVTSHSSKERYMNYFKDLFERGLMKVYSMDLLDEMKSIVRDQGTIEAYGRGKDDRAIATGLACVAYMEQVQPKLLAAKITRAISHAQEVFTPEEVAAQRTVSTYLKKIGMYGK
jgi:hypothetical protein